MESSKTKENVWLVVCNNENWDLAVEKGVFGVEKPSSLIRRIKQGDLYVAYIAGVGFIGWGKITGPYYESNIRIWKDKKYKYRFSISDLKESGKILPGAAIKDDLSFIKHKEKWGVHFRSGVVNIPVDDFLLIKKSLKKSRTTLSEVMGRLEEDKITSIDIGDKLHNRTQELFKNMGFSILDSNYDKPGPDIIVEDPQSIENSKIIIQCKNTESEDGPTYPSLDRLIDEYAHKIKKNDAIAAIIVLSGYKLSKALNYKEALEEDNVAIWTDDVIDYYEDLASKISSFARYQLLADMRLNLKFDKNRKFEAIKIKQNDYQFYVFSVEPEWLLKTTSVVRRINFLGAIGGYQRLLKKKRIQKDIPEYLQKEDWIFPNAIVCMTNPSMVMNFSEGKLNLPSYSGLFWIVDGQHRLYAFANSLIARLGKKSKILCAAIDSSLMGEDLDSKQAQIFVDLNMHTKKVDRSLLFELHDILGIKNIPVEIAFLLARESVFKGAIRGYSNKEGSINLTTFAANQAIKRLTSRRGPLLKGRKVEEFDDEKLKKYCFDKFINYFRNIERIFKKEWNNPSEYILKTDRGIRALFRLYIKILEKYENKNIEENTEKVLNALKKSQCKFDVELFKGKYYGEQGAEELVMTWSSHITKLITDFDPEVKRFVVDTAISKFGTIDILNKLENWIKNLDGDIRCKIMHIDETTLKYLRFLDIQKVRQIKIFFGDSNNENKIKEELKKMRADGHDIIFTRAQKKTAGALFHTRWIGDEKHQILLDCDLKEKAMKNATYEMHLIEWNKPAEIIDFDNYWDIAEKGYKFDYDWGA